MHPLSPVVKLVSPYLLRPLRSLDEALRDLEAGKAPPPPPAVPPNTTENREKSATTPQDTVTIAGEPVAVPPGEPTPPTTGGTVDVKA